MTSPKQFLINRAATVAIALMAGIGASTMGSALAAENAVGLQNGTIGFVMTEKVWSIYKSADNRECPNGYNDGPREEFKVLFPDDGTKYTVLETRLAREAAVWFPSTEDEGLPFLEAQGDTARGLNLDGEVDGNDYSSPDGKTAGIDNQFQRVFRCVAGYGTSDAYMTFWENRVMHDDKYGRILIEVTGVDSLENDDEVTLTTYRGIDNLLLDAAGKTFLPYSTQRIDAKWGGEFVQTFKGRIVDGVLTTEPADLRLPWPVAFSTSGEHLIHGARFQLDIDGEGAKGFIGGYVDIQQFYWQSNTGWSTHHQSYGQLSQPSVYRAMRRLADGYPDPETGENTAISSAIEVEFKQAYIVHPAPQTALDHTQTRQDVASSAD